MQKRKVSLPEGWDIIGGALLCAAVMAVTAAVGAWLITAGTIGEGSAGFICWAGLLFGGLAAGIYTGIRHTDKVLYRALAAAAICGVIRAVLSIVGGSGAVSALIGVAVLAAGAALGAAVAAQGKMTKHKTVRTRRVYKR